MQTILVDHQQLAWLDIANQLGAYDIQGTALTGYDIGAIWHLTQAKRPNTIRIQSCNQPILLQEQEGKAPLDHVQRLF